jgi:hypothetical protein
MIRPRVNPQALCLSLLKQTREAASRYGDDVSRLGRIAGALAPGGIDRRAE